MPLSEPAIRTEIALCVAKLNIKIPLGKIKPNLSVGSPSYCLLLAVLALS